MAFVPSCGTGQPGENRINREEPGPINARSFLEVELDGTFAKLNFRIINWLPLIVVHLGVFIVLELGWFLCVSMASIRVFHENLRELNCTLKAIQKHIEKDSPTTNK
jgi:hypothetical protein